MPFYAIQTVGGEQVSGVDEMFTHIDDDSTVRHFAVTSLIKHCNRMLDLKLYEVIYITVDCAQAEFIRNHNGVEPAHLNRLDPASAVIKPLIFCTFADGSNLLVDGNHRYVWAADQGIDALPAILVPQNDWELFLLNTSQPMSTEDARAYFLTPNET